MENADKEDAVTVAVTRDGRVFLGHDQVAARILAPRSATICRTRPDKRSIIRADARAQIWQGDGCD